MGRDKDKPDVELRCLHCRKWFKSDIVIDVESLKTAKTAGNEQQCPHCRKMTDCNADNWRVREGKIEPGKSEGGFVGLDVDPE